MIGIDSSVLVRYFTEDDAQQSRTARRFLQHGLSPQHRGHVSLVVLAELAWVLRSQYKTPRDVVIGIIEALLVSPHIAVQDAQAVWLALDNCLHANAGIADAMISAVNRLHGCTHTVTFDAKATRIPDMTLLR